MNQQAKTLPDGSAATPAVVVAKEEWQQFSPEIQYLCDLGTSKHNVLKSDKTLFVNESTTTKPILLSKPSSDNDKPNSESVKQEIVTPEVAEENSTEHNISASRRTKKRRATKHSTDKATQAKTTQEQSGVETKWLVDLYVSLWKEKRMEEEEFEIEAKHSSASELTITELFTRAVDPESPRWYFLPVQQLDSLYDYKVRRLCWLRIRDDIFKELKKSHNKQNIYAYHNAAVLSFLLNDSSTGFKILNYLIDTVFHPMLLRSISYFYIQSKKYYNSAAVLYHLVNTQKQKTDWHAIYLSMRLLSSYIEELKMQHSYQRMSANEFENLQTQKSQSMLSTVLSILPSSSSSKSSSNTTQRISEMEDFRHCVMHTVCKYNPKNDLYKLWQERWKSEMNEDIRRRSKSDAEMSDLEILSSEEFTVEEVVDNIAQFLKQVIKSTQVDTTSSVENRAKTTSSTRDQPVGLWMKVIQWVKEVFSKNKLLAFGSVLVAALMLGFTILARNVGSIFKLNIQNSFFKFPMITGNQTQEPPRALLQTGSSPETKLEANSHYRYYPLSNQGKASTFLEDDNLRNIKKQSRKDTWKPVSVSIEKDPVAIESNVTKDFEYVNNLYREIQQYASKHTQQPAKSSVSQPDAPTEGAYITNILSSKPVSQQDNETATKRTPVARTRTSKLLK